MEIPARAEVTPIQRYRPGLLVVLTSDGRDDSYRSPPPQVTTIAKKATHYDFPPPQVTTIAKKATHYDSLQDMVDDTRKHSRVKYGPMDIYKRPMTTAQAVGWHEEEVFNERFPKTQCAEVKYADCLVKSGWVS